MLKKIALFCLLLFATYSNAQKLIYLKNGNIANAEGTKLSPEKVRHLLATNTEILDLYNSGRSKKTAGNILFIGGLVLAAGDLVLALYSPLDSNGNSRVYPSALSYIGLGSFLISIPVKIGFSKKIEKVVDEYNKINGFVFRNTDELNIVFNENGVGLKYTF